MKDFSHWFGCMATLGVLMVCSYGNSVASSQALLVDILMGEPVTMESLLDDLETVRVVYVGEIHTIARHHAFQEILLRGFAERKPKLALGMEMFTQDQQPILDRWHKSTEDISALVKDLGGERWTNLNDYRDVLLAARELHIPIVCLNASGTVVHKVARKGLDGLTSEERASLPADLKERINPLNDRLLRLRLRVHKAFQGMSLDRIVLAQAVRDETVARGIVRFLQSAEGQDRAMMVIAGNGHLNYGFGIPDAVKREMDVASRIILSSESGELVLSEQEERQSVPITITHEELRFIRVPIADYLHMAPLSEPKTMYGNIR
jgi:uncharacterized iron-regulated protein